MKYLKFLICISFVLNIKQACSFEICKDIPVGEKLVETLNGRLQGECNVIPVSYSNNSIDNKNVLSFKSIPFADKPINQNRFKDPTPITSWNDTKNATKWPLACMQSFLDLEMMSEDCLYLNVFVQMDSYKNRSKELKPILIFIHGGGLVTGSSSEAFYNPSIMVAASDIVVVTIQYRLNAYGFLYLADTEAKGNQGFKDQIMAMKWVYDNADKFGGDNKKMTISGESAGAWSVGYHLFSKESWPYFRNAIMQSGGPTGSGNFYSKLFRVYHQFRSRFNSSKISFHR